MIVRGRLHGVGLKDKVDQLFQKGGAALRAGQGLEEGEKGLLELRKVEQDSLPEDILFIVKIAVHNPNRNACGPGNLGGIGLIVSLLAK